MFASVSTEIILFSSILVLLLYGIFTKGKFIKWGAVAINIFLVCNIIYYESTGNYTKVFLLVFSALFFTFLTKQERFESIILFLLSILGMLVAISANNLLLLYLSVELIALSFYILISLLKSKVEVTLKYLLPTTVASGFLLLGISLVYGSTGSIGYGNITTSIQEVESSIVPVPLLMGSLFVIVGIIIKLGIVPFHMWMLDVYQGIHFSLMLFFGSLVQYTFCIVLLKLFYNCFVDYIGNLQGILICLGILSQILGAIVGIKQENIRRLFAYSAIHNMGFILISLSTCGVDQLHYILFYIAIYTFLVFSTILLLGNCSKNLIAEDIKGTLYSRPWLGWGLVLLLLSLFGIPPFVGFFPKFYLLRIFVAEQRYILAVISILTIFLSLCYYGCLISSICEKVTRKEYPENIKLKTFIVIAIFLNSLYFLFADRLPLIERIGMIP